MSLSQLSSRVWQHGKVVAESVPLETLSDELANDQTLIWYDLTAPDREDIDTLADELDLEFHTVSIWSSTPSRILRPPASVRRSPAIPTISS